MTSRDILSLPREKQAEHAAEYHKRCVRNMPVVGELNYTPPPYPWNNTIIGNMAYSLLHLPLSPEQRTRLEGEFEAGLEWMRSH